MTRPRQPDAEALGVLFLCQGTFHAIPDDASLCEMLPRALERIPGVAAARLRLEGRSSDRWDVDDIASIPVSTFRQRYGAIEIKVADCEQYAVYEPFLRNLANTTGLFLENRRQQQQIEAQVRNLDGLIAERTAELNTANDNLRAELAARAHAERSLEFLVEASAILAESLDYSTTLIRVARLAVPFVADWCIVDLLEEGRRIRRVATAHVDPRKEALLREIEEREPPHWSSGHISVLAMRRGEPQLLSEATDEALAASCGGDPHCAQLIREVGVRSAMAVPLIAGGKTIGALALGVGAANRTYGPADLALAQELARRAAMAIDNAKLYQRAEDAIRARDEFLRIASHELKTPLSPLSLQHQYLLRMVRKDIAGEASVRFAAGLEAAERQVERLTHLIDDMLDIARAVTGRIDLELEVVDLTAVVREVAARYQKELAQADSTLTIAAEGSMLGTWDRMRLEQVVTNLLSNALKFGAGMPIEILVDGDETTGRLTVRDHGIGIAPEDQARIFERFERAASADRYRGFGVGLWIVRQIVGALGGNIAVESAPNAGATFTVALPRAQNGAVR